AAFEGIGYKDAFQVKMLPDDADLLDIRYNVIQWVHRATRGWSYGSGVVDPRTGEIIKGHVTLGSLRVRQDFLIAEGLTAPYELGTEEAVAAQEMALARIRQLSAHEVGHTLGFAHNFAAST
ncbi:MAG: peptidase, partial [Gammaproteobacteria bacterium]|nr:peptidase [Gammaproteobacteria bacterium]